MVLHQTVAHDALDVREWRDVDRSASHLVSPVPPVSLGHPAGYSSVIHDRWPLSSLHATIVFPHPARNAAPPAGHLPLLIQRG